MNILFAPIPSEQISPDQYRAWEQAAAASDLSDPLCNLPDWVLSYHMAHGRNRPVLMLFEHGNFFALAEDILPDGVPILVPLESSWLYDRPILGPDPVPLLIKSIDLLEEHYGRKHFPLTFLGGMWPHHPMSNEILLNLGHIFTFFLHGESVQCAASLEGGMDGFLSRRSANFRSKLKKALRRAGEEEITYERVCPKDEQSIQATYERMLGVEKKSWKGMAQNGLMHPLSTLFYKELITRTGRIGRARVIFALKDERDVGFIFGTVVGKIYRGQQFSYDLSLKNLSIGNTLQYQQILWLTEEKVLRYDMGPITGEKMSYKSHWTEMTFPLQSWVLKHNDSTLK